MTEEVVILSACRTPIGAFCGSLGNQKAHELGQHVIADAIKRAGIAKDDVSEVIFGQVLTAGQGQNPARQAAINAGLSFKVPATSVNMLCGSGLRSVIMATQAIKLGDSTVVVAGGQESMTQAQHAVFARDGFRMGHGSLVDTMISDGLTDAFDNTHMGITAENVAKLHNVSREEQDLFALNSQKKTANAIANGLFKDEILPMTITKKPGGSVINDEFPKFDTTIEKLKQLRPAFLRDGGGTVTAGNASGLNDGAAAIVLSSMSFAIMNGIQPLARVVSYACTGVEPSIMGLGPIAAIREALKKAKWTVNDVDLFELNEAFAAQSIAVVGELNLELKKVNVNGGAIALGHPIGASGARVLVTLLYALKNQNKMKGVAALCIGGGMGVAMCVERMVPN